MRRERTAADRLRAFRESRKLEPADLAAAMGLSESSYYDLEACPEDLFTSVSLKQLQRLSIQLGVPPRALFADIEARISTVAVEDVVQAIRRHLEANAIDIGTLEDRVGFTLHDCLTNSTTVLEWNVDCLRFVCDEIGLDWRAALPNP